jgi:hypothetical protein
VYSKWTGRHNAVGAAKFMSVEEFTEMIVQAGLLREDVGVSQIAGWFNLAMMTHVEEVE